MSNNPATQKVSKAQEFAARAHQGQKYGDHPYTKHLEDVVQVLERHRIADPNFISAGWLHDVVEDTSVKLEHIAILFGSRVQELVWAVTNPPGNNRAERHAVSYPRIVEVGATPIKLADRIANVTSCLEEGNTKLLAMYLSEHEEFKRVLHKPGRFPDHSMWDELNDLLVIAAEELHQ